MQHIIKSVINDIPSYLESLSIQEWNHLLKSSSRNEGLYEMFAQYSGKKQFISELKSCFFDKEISTLIILLWSKDQYFLREEYLKAMERNCPSRTRIFSSISEYPRTDEVPQDLQYDSSILEGFEVVEKEFVPVESGRPSGFFGNLFSSFWGAPAANPAP